jgi:hypothetical protein
MYDLICQACSLFLLTLKPHQFVVFEVINGEKAAFNNTVFGKRKKRTIEAIIKTMHSSLERDAGSIKVI